MGSPFFSRCTQNDVREHPNDIPTEYKKPSPKWGTSFSINLSCHRFELGAGVVSLFVEKRAQRKSKYACLQNQTKVCSSLTPWNEAALGSHGSGKCASTHPPFAATCNHVIAEL
jgi:hypothetical protein